MADLDHLERQLGRLRDQLAILAGNRPTPEQLRGEDDADKGMARRIHQARPGIPPQHILGTLKAFRAVLDMEPTEPAPVSPELTERIRAAIESELYEYRERTGFWPEGGVTTEIARLATRGALEALGAPQEATTEATEPEKCCVCGKSPVTRHDFRDRPFCTPCTDTHATRIEEALAEALLAFGPVSSHTGVRIAWTVPHPVSLDDFERWNAALKPSTKAGA